MRNRIKYELFLGLQYLLIGIVAEMAVHRWFRPEPPDFLKQIATWIGIALLLGLLRFAAVIILNLTRRDQWQTISRRNWI